MVQRICRYVAVFCLILSLAFLSSCSGARRRLIESSKETPSETASHESPPIDGSKTPISDGSRDNEPTPESDPKTENPLYKEFSDRQFTIVPSDSLRLDMPEWSVIKRNRYSVVYQANTTIGDDPIHFSIVNISSGTAVEVFGYGVELGESGEFFVADWNFSLFKVDSQGRGVRLLCAQSAVGNMAYNSSLKLLAFEVDVYEGMLRGVALYDLNNNSWRVLASGRNDQVNIHVLWWKDNTIIVNRLDRQYGLFLHTLDLEGTWTKHLSFDDPIIPIFGWRLFNPELSQILLLHRQTKTVWLFDLTDGTYVSFEGYMSARWNNNLQLLGLDQSGKEQLLALK